MGAIDFKRTVKRVDACCKFGPSGEPTGYFEYIGEEGVEEVIVSHPLGFVPLVFVMELYEGEWYEIDPTIQYGFEAPYDITVRFEPLVENFKIVLY